MTISFDDLHQNVFLMNVQFKEFPFNFVKMIHNIWFWLCVVHISDWDTEKNIFLCLCLILHFKRKIQINRHGFFSIVVIYLIFI